VVTVTQYLRLIGASLPKADQRFDGRQSFPLRLKLASHDGETTNNAVKPMETAVETLIALGGSLRLFVITDSE